MLSGAEIVERIEQLATAKGVSVTRAAKDGGVGEGTLRKMRTRDSRGSVDTLVAMASALGTTVGYLLGETDDPSPYPPQPTSGQGGRRLVADFDIFPTEGHVCSEWTDDIGDKFEFLIPSEKAGAAAMDLEEAAKRARRYSFDNPPKPDTESA